MAPKLHTRNVAFIIICVAGLLGIGLFGILPNSKILAELDLEVKALNDKISNQKVLMPVFQQLIKRIREKDENQLLVPKRTKISQEDIDDISDLIQKLALENNLVLRSVSSDVKAFLEDTNFISINLIITGDFFNFRQMLMDLERLPYLEKIESFQMDVLQKKKRFDLKLMVAKQ